MNSLYGKGWPVRKAIGIVHGRESSLDYGSGKWPDSRDSEAEPIELTNGLDVGCEKEKRCRGQL